MNESDQKKKRIRDLIVASMKSHSESRSYKKYKQQDIHCSLDLGFKDKEIEERFENDSIVWKIWQTNKNNINTLSAKLFLNGIRIRGIDRNPSKPSFKYQKSSIPVSFWHENIVYSENGNDEGVNNHNPLPEEWNKIKSIDSLALKSAIKWNIETWSDTENYLF